MQIKNITRSDKPKRIVLATTAERSDGSRATLEDLQKIHNIHQQFLIPIGVKHDPRIPPQARILSSEIIEKSKDLYVLEGEVEWFDKAADQLQTIEDKEIRVRKFAEPAIIYDSHFNDEQMQELIYELKVLFNGRAEEERKTEDPFLSILSMGASYPFGGIYKRFQERLDRRQFKSFKGLMHHLIYRKTKAEEKLLSFQAGIHHGNQVFNVEVILTNPKPRQMNRFFEKDLKKLDGLVMKHYQPGRGVRKLVYKYQDRDIQLLYGVHKNGLPLVSKKRS